MALIFYKQIFISILIICVTAHESFEYKMIHCGRNKKKPLLMYKGHTYYQHMSSKMFYCSKRKSGCLARIKLDDDGKIIMALSDHKHLAPKCIELYPGKFVKI